MTGAPAARPNGGTVDLHSHSTASDGALPPDAVVRAAHAAGLAALALSSAPATTRSPRRSPSAWASATPAMVS